MVQTLTGRAGAVSEVKTRRAQPRTQGPKEATQAELFFDREKEWSELRKDMESEEDPWAGMAMDGAVSSLT